LGKRDTQDKLLATWQTPVPTMGNPYPPQVTGNLANICTYIGQERYPAQVTGNLANICTCIGKERYQAQVTGNLADICTCTGQERYQAQFTGNLAHITILDDKFVVVLCTLIM
jgi:hypothetical protein